MKYPEIFVSRHKS